MEDITTKVDDSGIDMPADGVPQAAETAVIEPLAEADEEQAEAGDEAAAKGDSATSKKRRNIVIGVIAATTAVAIGVGAFACSSSQQQPAEEPQAAVEQEPGEEALETQEVTLAYEADGLQDGASPIIAHIEGSTEDEQEVDFYHAMRGETDTVELYPGSYTVSFVGAVNPDGSIVVPKSSEGQKLTFGKDSKPSKVGQAFDKVEAGDVAEGQVEGILDQIAEAVKKGDSTLTGEAGKQVADTAAENAKANEKVDSEKVDEAKQEAESSADSGSQASIGGSSSSAASGSSSQASSGSSSSGSSSSSSSSSSSTSGGGSSQQSSSHTHNRVAQTEQRWVSNPVQVWVQDSAAYDENQYSYVYKCDLHGYTFSTDAELDAHLYSLPDSEFARDGNTVIRVVSGTIHHDATGHYETQDQGYYETVTTGYVCSVCGAQM